MRYVALIGLGLSGLCACQPSPESTNVALPAIRRIEPRPTQELIPDMERLAHAVATRLTDSHYRELPLNDTFSTLIFDRFIDDLDPQRILLTQADIASLAPYRLELDDQLRNSAPLTFPWLAVELVERRAEELLLFAGDFFDVSPLPLDHGALYQPDRRFAERPADDKAQHRLWGDLITYEILAIHAVQTLDDERIMIPNRPAVPPYLRALPEKEQVTLKLLCQLRSLRNPTQRSAVDRFLNVYAKCFDPHSGFQSPANFARRLNHFARGATVGLGVDFIADEGLIRISRVHPKSVAQQAGIKVNDIILSITDSGALPMVARGLSTAEIVACLSGVHGIPKTFTIAPANFPDSPVRTVVAHYPKPKPPVQRSEVTSKMYISKLPDGSRKRICEVMLPGFYTKRRDTERIIGSASEVEDALNAHLDSGPIDAIILDLRRNGGGYVDEAARLASLFIPAGPILQRRKRGSLDLLLCTDTEPKFRQPLVIMTSRHTASSAEIFTGAMQDYGRALVVGDHSSYGKGTVQENLDYSRFARAQGFPSPAGGLYYTGTKSYRLDGNALQVRGIIPDIVIPSDTDSKPIGDHLRENHLPYDAIDSVAIVTWPEPVMENLPELRLRSVARVTVDSTLATYLTDDSFVKPDAPTPVATPPITLGEKPVFQRLKTARLDAIEKAEMAQKEKELNVQNLQRAEVVNIVRDLLSLEQSMEKPKGGTLK